MVGEKVIPIIAISKGVVSIGKDGTIFQERILSIQKEVDNGAILAINNGLYDHIKQFSESL